MMKTATQIGDEVLAKLAREYVGRNVVPERAGLDVATQGNVHMNRAIQQSAAGAPHVNIPQSSLTATGPAGGGLMGKFKKLPTWGKAGLGIGAGIGALALGKHFLGSNQQQPQQYYG